MYFAGHQVHELYDIVIHKLVLVQTYSLRKVGMYIPNVKPTF